MAAKSIILCVNLEVALRMLADRADFRSFLAEHFGYHSAFWFALAVNAAGVLWYFLRTKQHFEQNKLR